MKCKCGHDEEDHTREDDPDVYGGCSECEECTGFEAAEEDVVHSDFAEQTSPAAEEAVETPATASTSTVAYDPNVPQTPAAPVEYTVVVELLPRNDAEAHAPRRLIKFLGFQQALASPLVPHSSRVWVSRAAFLANADPLEYEDLVDFHDAAQKAVSDDVAEARMTLKSRMYDRLLDLAWTPEQAASELGVRAKEGRVPKAKKEKAAPDANGSKRSYSKLDPDTKIEKLVDKNPAREGSATAERFGLIKNNMKVSAYVAAGGKATYLTYFEKAGHIRLVPPA